MFQLLLYHLIFYSAVHNYHANSMKPNSTYLHRKRLLRNLFDGNKYDKRVRPIYDIQSPINVYLKLNLYQISEVNTPHQYMTLYLWVLQCWKDEFLYWDPNHYGDVESVVLPEEHVWLPDMNLENNLRPNHMLNERRTGVILYTNTSDPERRATVFFPFPASYKFMCQMNVAMFPFDTQTCVMIFGSWNYFSEQIQFIPFNSDVFREGYTEHNEWEVIDFKMEPFVGKSDVPGRNHSCIKATIVIKRRALSYLVTLVCPTLLTTFVSLVGFFMPTSASGQRREKMTLGINTLLTMSVLLLGISDQMPSTSSSVPLIGRYTGMQKAGKNQSIMAHKPGYFPAAGIFYVGMIVVTAVGTLCTTLVIELQRRSLNNKRAGASIKNLLGHKIAWFIGMTPPKLLKKLEEDMYSSSIKRNNSVSSNDSDGDEKRDTCKKRFNVHLSKIRQSIQHFNRKIFRRKQQELVIMEWDWLADIVDRLFLLFWITVFGVFVFVLSSVGFFCT